MPVSELKMQSVVDQLYQVYKDRLNLTGVDFGMAWKKGKPTGKNALRLHVSNKLCEPYVRAEDVFPKTFKGYDIDVIEARYKSSSQTAADGIAGASSVVMGGISCGRVNGGAGTIGAVVVDQRTGAPGILSNWHVLHGQAGSVGDPILQPSLLHSVDFSARPIASLTNAFLDADGDAAVAMLKQDCDWLPSIRGAQRSIQKTRVVRLGEILKKSGAVTGVTTAQVDGIGIYRTEYEVRIGVYETRDIKGFKMVPVDRNTDEVLELSERGDSGSLWYNEKTGDAVGLHFAGELSFEPEAEHAVACHIISVLDRLQVRLAGSQDMTCV